MADPLDDGASYLRALKSSGAAAAPARATAPAAASFQGSEKRRSARYKCEGSAQIREDGCNVHTWASFTDISLNGCYVEAQATYPAGATLHLKLDANDIRVETKGQVRVSYPYLGMGIAFVDMSPENVDSLKRLLASISRPNVLMGRGIASSLPATNPLPALPPVAKPEAALLALMEFFETHQMLLRDDFVKILERTQK